MKALPLVVTKHETIYIEFDDTVELEGSSETRSVGLVAGGDAGDLIERLASMGDAIATICRTLKERASSSLDTACPDELEITFGLKLGGEAGIPLVSKGTAESSLQVTAKWTFPDARTVVAR